MEFQGQTNKTDIGENWDPNYADFTRQTNWGPRKTVQKQRKYLLFYGKDNNRRYKSCKTDLRAEKEERYQRWWRLKYNE